VRRALRLAAKHRDAYHQRWFKISLGGMVPLCPLLVSPFPNLPLYYLGYRLYSHQRASKGARAAITLLNTHNAQSRQRLRAAILELESEGHAPRAGSRAAELAAQAPAQPTSDDHAELRGVQLTLEGSSELAELTDPGRKCAPAHPAPRVSCLGLTGVVCSLRPTSPGTILTALPRACAFLIHEVHVTQPFCRSGYRGPLIALYAVATRSWRTMQCRLSLTASRSRASLPRLQRSEPALRRP